MELFEHLAAFEETLLKLRRSLAAQFPAPYGSEAWWKKSDVAALESIKRGKGRRFGTFEDAIAYLHS